MAFVLLFDKSRAAARDFYSAGAHIGDIKKMFHVLHCEKLSRRVENLRAAFAGTKKIKDPFTECVRGWV